MCGCRSSDRHIDNSLMHSDPEALMRALKQPRRSTTAARAASPASETPPQQHQQQQQQQQEGVAAEQQQQHQQQQYVASTEVEMAEAEQPAAAASVGAVEESRLTISAAAAVFGPAAAEAAAAGDEQQQQQQEDLHVALKSIETNGQGRKRAAAAAELAQDDRPNKQQATTVAPANGRIDAAAAAVQQLGHQTDGQLDEEADLAAAGAGAAQPKAADVARAGELLHRLVSATPGMNLSELELLYARLTRIVIANEAEGHRDKVLEKLSTVVGDLEQPTAAIPAGDF